MAREVYAFREGVVWLWTGTAGSATLAYAEGTEIALTRGWQNYRTFDDVYHDVQTGRVATFRVQALYTRDHSALMEWFEAATAVHAHFIQNATGLGSAGLFLYSGRLDALQQVGREKGMFQLSLMGHSNEWSAYY